MPLTGEALAIALAVMLSVYGVHKIGHGVKVLYHHTAAHIVHHRPAKK